MLSRPRRLDSSEWLRSTCGRRGRAETSVHRQHAGAEASRLASFMVHGLLRGPSRVHDHGQ